MFRSLSLAWLVLSLLCAGCAPTDEPKRPPQVNSINVATWGGPYTDAEKRFFGDPFSAETGIAVNYLSQSNSPTATALLQARSGHITIDVVNSENPAMLAAQGLLADFPEATLAALKATSVEGSVLPQQFKMGQTAVVIACNRDMMQRCPRSPAEFFDLESFPGPRSVSVELPWTALHFALVADGVPAAQTYPMDIDRAITKLATLKGRKDVVFTQSANQAEQVLNDGEVGVAYLPHGSAFKVSKNLKNLQVYWEGATVTNDGLAVMKDAPNPEAAFAYIRWIAEHPQAQAGFSGAVSYPTPAKNLKDFLDPALYQAMPAAHNVVTEDGEWLAKNMPELQRKFQEFLAGY